jgi:hypothetical protein
MKLRWNQVPGWFNFEDIYQEAVDLAPAEEAHFVEVGVLLGRSTLFLAEAIRRSGKKITLDAVDKFKFTTEGLETLKKKFAARHPDADLSRTSEIYQHLPSGHRATVTKVIDLSGLGDAIHLIESSGQEQAKKYEDESLDLVFVDAEHTYEDTRDLLVAYLPKMRPGGTLAGHDYHPDYPGVERAVREVLGSEHEVRGISFTWRKR